MRTLHLQMLQHPQWLKLFWHQFTPSGWHRGTQASGGMCEISVVAEGNCLQALQRLGDWDGKIHAHKRIQFLRYKRQGPASIHLPMGWLQMVQIFLMHAMFQQPDYCSQYPASLAFGKFRTNSQKTTLPQENIWWHLKWILSQACQAWQFGSSCHHVTSENAKCFKGDLT